MKFDKSIFLFLGATACNAFVLPKSTFTRQSARFMQDTSEAVKAAMEASEKYGRTSPEARLAWNLVEELDAANSHEKAMAKQIQQQQEEISRLQKVVEDNICEAPTVHADTSDAVKNALEASRIYGKTSVEARMAWDLVEELDAANSHHRPDNVHVAQATEVECSTEEPVMEMMPNKAPETLDEAINEAMLATKVYGAQAMESRMAWELVEEMEASSSHKRDEAKIAEKTAVEAEAPEEEEEDSEPSVPIDTSKAIKTALEASKKYGKTSVEARMAWEYVEEVDAANAHAKQMANK